MKVYVFTMHLQFARSAPLVLLFAERPTPAAIAARLTPMVNSGPPGAHPSPSRFQDVIESTGLSPDGMGNLFAALEREHEAGHTWPSRELYHERATFSLQLFEINEAEELCESGCRLPAERRVPLCTLCLQNIGG